METEIEAFIDVISAAYSDPEVKKDGYMQKVLFEAAKELTKGREPYVISSQLRKEIQLYSMRNEFKSPKTVQNLYDFLYEKKDGFAYSPISPDVWKGL